MKKKIKYYKNGFLSIVFAALVLVGTALTASAQYDRQEYRDLQSAQRQEQMRHNDYLRTNSPSDYRQWQRAQNTLRERELAWQRLMEAYNNGYYARSNSGRINANPNGYYTQGVRFRVYGNGSYSTDSRGVELLRQAVRSGYEQGYREGQRDRMYNRRYNYNSNGLYMSGSFGYDSYVARNQYEYYFRQGFQRGYQDGYYSTTRYGYRNGGSFSILGNILDTIIRIKNN